MEHIPRVRDSSLEVARLSVPYLAGTWEYGSRLQGVENFTAFPAKHGFRSLITENDETKGKNEDLKSPPIEVLQAWLYFGLLAEAFGTPEMRFKASDFITRSSSGEEVVTTRELSRYIWYWTAAITHGHRDDYDEHCENLDRCLEVANTVINNFSRAFYSSPDGRKQIGRSEWFTTTTTLFSIITLTDYIRRARIDINAFAFEAKLPELEWDFPPLDHALKMAGWCEGEIAKLKSTTDCSTRFYLAQIERFALGKDHAKCSVTKGCQAHQIYEPTYRTRHRPDCKRAMCWNLGPEGDDVVRILEEGGYPLVTFEDEKSLRIKSAQEDDIYVTISHVWSDGLGNPHANELPHCQLVYIQSLVNALYPESQHPIPFWNDTLCIPVHPDHLRYRKLAINRMHKTFRSSHKTLALDNSLMTQATDNNNEHNSNDWVEMNMRIKYSPWVSRAWTLLEGRVGKELLFQFMDKAVSADVVFNPSFAEKNIRFVSGMLEERGVETVLNEPNAIRLARALLLLPKEPRPEEDDEDIIQAAKDAYTTWHPILSSSNLASAPTDLDDDMSVNIQRHRITCPVTKHSNSGTKNIRDEFWLETIEEDYSGPSYESHVYFEGVCNAFRGRTTSKVEDETLCFGQMLGIDTSGLIAVRPLSGRARYWLTILDSYPFLRALAQSIGIDLRERLTECQEKRIQELLLQVGKLPLSMVLWDTPRMRSQGWKWAPLSLLGAAPSGSASTGWASNERGTVSPEGLVVALPALRLKSPAGMNEGLDIPVSEAVYLNVSTMDSIHGANKAVFRVELKINEYSPWRRYKTWSSLVQSRILDRLVILTRRRASVYDPFQKRGILIEVREERDGANLADFKAIVDRPHEHEVTAEELPAISVDGDWDTQSNWCIG